MSYKCDEADKIHVESELPLFGVRLVDFADLSEYSMVEDQSIKTAKGLDSQVDCLLAKREICQIAVEHLDLLIVLLLELLERFDAASDHDDIVRLWRGKKVLCNGESDA
jgi:hypothetical protein